MCAGSVRKLLKTQFRERAGKSHAIERRQKYEMRSSGDLIRSRDAQPWCTSARPIGGGLSVPRAKPRALPVPAASSRLTSFDVGPEADDADAVVVAVGEERGPIKDDR